MALMVKVDDPFFQHQPREAYPKMQIWCTFCDSSSIPLQGIAKKSRIFLVFWVKMTKLTLQFKVNDPHFQYQLR